MNELTNALIVVDVQRDFCPGGTLPVENGDDVATMIHQYLVEHETAASDYPLVVATKDWHPDDPNFDHFSNKPNYINTWPPHCIAGTPGAKFHPNLGAWDDDTDPSHDGTPNDSDVFKFDAIFYKGQKAAAYSGFEGQRDKYSAATWDLNDHLERHRIRHVDIVGLATDYCVFATAMDAIKRGYDTSVLLDLCAGVDEETTRTAIEQMAEAGVHVDRTS